MNLKRIRKILASAGIIYAGMVSSDVIALADAIQDGSAERLIGFAAAHPDSEFAEDALRLANLRIVPAAQDVTLQKFKVLPGGGGACGATTIYESDCHTGGGGDSGSRSENDSGRGGY